MMRLGIHLGTFRGRPGGTQIFVPLFPEYWCMVELNTKNQKHNKQYIRHA